MTRIVQVSDLHFGASDARIARMLAARIAEIRPDAVVVSGDLTQNASRAEFAAANEFLNALDVPQLIIPGNHDIPALNLLERFFRPSQRFRKFVHDDKMPVLEMGNVFIVGIDTTRRGGWHLDWSRGRISNEKIEVAAEILHSAPVDACKVVVMHHPLVPTDLARGRKGACNADKALATFVEAGVTLIMTGHFHVSDLVVWPSGDVEKKLHHLHCSTAISTRLRGQPNAWYELEVYDREVVVAKHSWDGDDFQVTPLATLPFDAHVK